MGKNITAFMAVITGCLVIAAGVFLPLVLNRQTTGSAFLNPDNAGNSLQWQELPQRRTATAKTYAAQNRPGRYRQEISLAPVHYESIPASGQFDRDINLTPRPVKLTDFDGWQITDNSWHFRLGQPAGKADGWIGFGFNQGKNWVDFRLEQAGWIDWNTGQFTPLGPTADYQRRNLALSSKPDSPHSSVINWQNLWQLPGNGTISGRWTITPSRLKEEIILNQAARNWLKNQPPPKLNTYYGFMFRLEGSTDQLAANLAENRLYVKNPAGEIIRDLSLESKIITQNHQTYIALAAPIKELNSLPEGELIFDPTIDVQVSAGLDDGDENSSGTVRSGALPLLRVDGTGEWVFFRFTGISIDAGASIDVAYLSLNWQDSDDDEPDLRFYGEDTQTPAQVTSGTATYSLSTRSMTTASVDWGSTDLGAPSGDGFVNTGSLVTIIDELVASYTYSSGVMAFLATSANNNTARDAIIQSYESSSSQAAKLHIEWSSGNTPPNVPSLDEPTNTATDVGLTPMLKTTATDIDDDRLRYKIELCENEAMTSNCQTFDQTVSQTGWSLSRYDSDQQAIYTIQSSLGTSTTYYWRSYAIDQDGSNTWSSTQGTPYSFTTTANSGIDLHIEGLKLEGLVIN